MKKPSTNFEHGWGLSFKNCLPWYFEYESVVIFATVNDKELWKSDWLHQCKIGTRLILGHSVPHHSRSMQKPYKNHIELRRQESTKALYGSGRNKVFSFHKTLPDAISASDHWLILSEFRFHACNAWNDSFTPLGIIWSMLEKAA